MIQYQDKFSRMLIFAVWDSFVNSYSENLYTAKKSMYMVHNIWGTLASFSVSPVKTDSLRQDNMVCCSCTVGSRALSVEWGESSMGKGPGALQPQSCLVFCQNKRDSSRSFLKILGNTGLCVAVI